MFDFYFRLEYNFNYIALNILTYHKHTYEVIMNGFRLHTYRSKENGSKN